MKLRSAEEELEIQRRLNEMTPEEAQRYFREMNALLRQAQEHLLQLEVESSKWQIDQKRFREIMLQLQEDFYRLGIPGFTQKHLDC